MDSIPRDWLEAVRALHSDCETDRHFGLRDVFTCGVKQGFEPITTALMCLGATAASTGHCCFTLMLI